MPISRILAAACLSAMLVAPQLAPLPALAANTPRGGFAGISADGSLVYGSGVKQSKSTDFGSYELTFKRSIAECAYLVQAGTPQPGAGGGSLDVTTFARRHATARRKLEVFTVVQGAGLSDHGFFVHVVC